MVKITPIELQTVIDEHASFVGATTAAEVVLRILPSLLLLVYIGHGWLRRGHRHDVIDLGCRDADCVLIDRPYGKLF